MFGSRLGPPRKPKSTGLSPGRGVSRVLAARFAGPHAAEAGRRDTAGSTWHVEDTSDTDGDGVRRNAGRGVVIR
ncbi:hypothetical protein KVR01_012607 [Diaporthe batatas]|uniref:uncharacterized protein n=1 Tax=Diaporthe batatas TaxID=748121 RepID=UPI001D04B27E|nr:uncharacterized protein KVR01_012607 [Diaporthe batatas]KAG8157565.1 hypothetical protein KVR01_012607 [Diaporthe batatas]